MGGNGSGDRLARGAHKVQFPAPGAAVTQKKWDAIFGEDTGPKPNVAKTKKSRKKS